MKVMQIFASPSWGGGEQYVYDLSVNLIKCGHEVNFFSRKSSVIDKKISSINTTCQHLPFRGILDIYSIIKLALFLRNNPLDVIHIHCFKVMSTVILAKILSRSKAKIVMTRHLIKEGKNNILYRWCYRHLDQIIFVSKICQNTFLNSVTNFPRTISSVVYNSIPVVEDGHLNSESIRKKCGIKEDCPLIFFVGRVVREKGIEEVIKALASVRDKDFYLIVIGQGKDSYLKQLKKLLIEKKLASRVLFLGYTDHARQLIKEADIGVAPSICQESFGLTVAEFMQAGKCVITTNNGAQCEFVDHGKSGWLVNPGDVGGLSYALRKLMDDDQMRLKLGTHAKNYFDESLAYNHFYNNIMQVYQNRIAG